MKTLIDKNMNFVINQKKLDKIFRHGALRKGKKIRNGKTGFNFFMWKRKGTHGKRKLLVYSIDKGAIMFHSFCNSGILIHNKYVKFEKAGFT